MATSRPSTTSTSPEKAPRQVKSKNKSRSGCQACKLRRLKCDETKPACRNCQKKGQECPGYTLRLQWSTKYERPRAPSRLEPTNFEQLVSAVTQSIVPPSGGAQTTRPRIAEPAHSVKSVSSSSASSESPAPSESTTRLRLASETPSVQTKPSQSPPATLTSFTSAPAIPTPFSSAHQSTPVALGLLADAGQPDYSSAVDLTTAHGYLDFNPTSLLSSNPVSGGSSWGNSRNNSPAAVDIDGLVALASSGDVDEPEATVTGSNLGLRPPGQSIVRLGHIVPPAPQLARPLVDIPSFLIEHWFKSVCTSWSAFDNPGNPYRQLSSSLWHSSMAVFYALQSMAAASLVEHLPHLKEVAHSAPRLATQAITYELQDFRAASKAQFIFPRGLVLSLFCMSSSIAWTDSRQFGLQFLKPGRAVLNCLNKMSGYLSASDRELLDFFNGCLIYEEMLRSIVSNDDADMEYLASWHVSPGQVISVEPHAWTGVSPDLLRLLGKTMFLCRRSRNRWRQSDMHDADKILNETADYQEAAVIEEVLLQTELPEALPVDETMTSEGNAVKRDLRSAAEAYRLSSLLQLYLTFPSLIARRMPEQVDTNSGLVPTSSWLSPLALHIANILRSISPSSDMRCLQPLLCLCAGTGLRYDNADLLLRGQTNPFMPSNITQTVPGIDFASPLGTPASAAFGLSSLPGLSTSVLGENDLEIASARRFLMERLSRLEQNLPPKPIQVERELLRSIWAVYDSESDGACTTHWLDVMVNNELESVFG